MSINRVNITGNLTRDAELRTTQGGTAIASFGVAVNERRKNQRTDEWEDYANFVDCTMFGRRAEAIAQYLTKGTKVAIEGKLHYSSWEKDGQRRSKLDVTVDEIEFMASRQNAAQGAQPQQGGSYPYQQQRTPQATNQHAHAPQQAYQQPEMQSAYNDEDIPF